MLLAISGTGKFHQIIVRCLLLYSDHNGKNIMLHLEIMKMLKHNVVFFKDFRLGSRWLMLITKIK